MKRWLPLLIITLIALVLRFYQLGIIPLGFTWDEASIIYNAWGIALWHRDEFANLMPLAFKSFGDYKAPLLFYLLALPYKLFGIQEILIRLYSAIAGVLAVVFIYFLTKVIYPRAKYLAPLAAFLLAVSPWAVNFSRVGFEANIALTIVIIAQLLLIYGKTKPQSWYWSALFFAISLYAYHSSKIFTPLILISFFIINRKQIFSRIKPALISCLIFIVLVLPLIHATIFSSAFERGKTLIFFDQGHLASPAAIVTEFVTNCGHQLSLNFWLNGQDAVGLRHLVPGSGVIYKTELIFLLIGLLVLLTRRQLHDQYLLSWFVAGLMPAILSHQTPHAVRSLLVLPAVILITTVGFMAVFKRINSSYSKLSKIFIILVVISLSYNIFTYLYHYYTDYAIASAADFQFGYQQALLSARQRGKTKDKIIVTDKYGQPYIFVLLYNRITPEEFLAGALANYEFHTIHWPEFKPNSVFVATPEEITPHEAAVKELITIPNTDKIVFVIVETPKLSEE